MPNQYNFRSDVTTRTEKTYYASRIIRLNTEPFVFESGPASFGFDPEDNIEIHLYSIPDNALIYSMTIGVDEVNDDGEPLLKSHIVRYNDETFRTHIRINFTDVFATRNTVIIPGDYRATFNFFSDEIGSYNNKNLLITQISPSRTEIEVRYSDIINTDAAIVRRRELKEFIEPSLTKPFAVGFVDKTFKSGVELNDATEGVKYENVIANIGVNMEDAEAEVLQTYNSTIARIDRIGRLPHFQNKIDEFVKDVLYPAVRSQLLATGDERIQSDEMEIIIQDIVYEKISILENMVGDNRMLIN